MNGRQPVLCTCVVSPVHGTLQSRLVILTKYVTFRANMYKVQLSRLQLGVMKRN